ncbi:hypothetical protein R1flu_001163 [Riccia fluitans]|uniref:Uncharacterized protein n=1 Tax=Riccia fluitans TaxID=41844 RepID=A0ABD1Y2P7_9MARC
MDPKQKVKAMANKPMLKGQHIWMDQALTPLQMEQKWNKQLEEKSGRGRTTCYLFRLGHTRAVRCRRLDLPPSKCTPFERAPDGHAQMSVGSFERSTSSLLFGIKERPPGFNHFVSSRSTFGAPTKREDFELLINLCLLFMANVSKRQR